MSRPRRQERRLSLSLALVLLCACAGSADSPPPRETLPPTTETTGRAEVAGVGTLRLFLRDRDRERAAAAIAPALEAAERTATLLLRSRESSEIGILNRVPMQLWVELSRETAAALRRADDIARETGGAYDPTDPPLARLWGFPEGPARSPRDFEIDAALRNVDWTDLEVEQDDSAVRRLSRRTEIDLGALAKGAVVDAALRSCRNAGVPAARVAAPGLHAAYLGMLPEPWRIDLRLEPDGLPFATLLLHEGGVAVVRPTVELEAVEGGPLPDRIDPRSGRPALEARFVVAAEASASRAGAFASALFMMGAEAEAFAAERESLGAAGRLRTDETWADPDLEEQLEWWD